MSLPTRVRATFGLALGALLCTLVSLALFAGVGQEYHPLLALQVYVAGMVAAAAAVLLARGWTRTRKLGTAALVLLGLQMVLALAVFCWLAAVDPPFG